MFEACRPARRLFLLLLPVLAASLVAGQTLPTTTISENLFSHRSGADKKDAVMTFLQTALSMGDAVMSREIVDQGKFKEGLSKIIDGTVECFNSSIWAQGQPNIQPASTSQS